MAEVRDGGKWALAGYLYQLVVTFGLSVWADAEDRSDSQELSALASLAETAGVYLERLGQDILLASLGLKKDDIFVLVQVKYSSQRPPAPVTSYELIEIARKLAVSASAASALGREVTGYALITNRRIDAAPEQLADSPPPGKKGGRLRLTADTKTVLKALRIVSPIPQETWLQGLVVYAGLYGIAESEVEAGVDRLVGHIMRKTAAGSSLPLTRTIIAEALTGTVDARKLLRADAEELSTRNLAEFWSLQNIQDDEGRPARRQIVDDIRAAVAERAFVVVLGHGGYGKSVALYEWAAGLAETLVIVQPTQKCPSGWLTQVVCEWAGIGELDPRRDRPTDNAMARLLVANPEFPRPILCLALDGADEYGANVDAIRNTLNWFWDLDTKVLQEGKRPYASLVITCRTLEDLETVGWLNDVSGRGYMGNEIRSVIVDRFSDAELLDAAESQSPTLKLALSSAIQADSPAAIPTAFASGLPPFSKSILNEMLHAIRQPAMWGALMELREDNRLPALMGASAQTASLAKNFLNRFSKRARRRVYGIEERNIEPILRHIAARTRTLGQGGGSVHEDWVRPLQTLGMFGDLVSQTLYREARSYGLVWDSGLGQWRWSHGFVEEYLAEPPSNNSI
jgi:hypothetical protein